MIVSESSERCQRIRLTEPSWGGSATVSGHRPYNWFEICGQCGKPSTHARRACG